MRFAIQANLLLALAAAFGMLVGSIAIYLYFAISLCSNLPTTFIEMQKAFQMVWELYQYIFILNVPLYLAIFLIFNIFVKFIFKHISVLSIIIPVIFSIFWVFYSYITIETGKHISNGIFYFCVALIGSGASSGLFYLIFSRTNLCRITIKKSR